MATDSEVNAYFKTLSTDLARIDRSWLRLEQETNEWQSFLSTWSIGADRSIPTERHKPRVALLLGSDREIGREVYTPERRVGITPEQAKDLKTYLEHAGIIMDLLVVRGAGERCGDSDQAYMNEAEAQIVDYEDLPKLERAPDVVHALKEPSCYEATIRGPFMRIGALHTGTFHQDLGVAKLLIKGNYSGIFDGSFVGGCSYLDNENGSYCIPIRSSMSIFAGMDAAVTVLDHVRSLPSSLKKNVVVVGGGEVGRTAAKIISIHGRDLGIKVTLLDLPHKLASIRDSLIDLCDQGIIALGPVDSDHISIVEHLRGSVALVLSAAVPGKRAPKVVDIDELSVMAREVEHGSPIVVDVSIDEGGAINVVGQEDNSTIDDIVETVASRLETMNVEYVAEQNMPRKYPKQAAERHGRAVVPYLGLLLRLSSSLNGPVNAVDFLRKRPIIMKQQDSEHDYICFTQMLAQDLRNGLAFSNLFFMDEPAIKGPRPIRHFLRDIGK